MNFWYYIIQGFLSGALGIYLPYAPNHNEIGIASAVTTYGVEMFTLTFLYLGMFIRLQTLFRLVLVILMLWLVKKGFTLLNIISFLRFFI